MQSFTFKVRREINEHDIQWTNIEIEQGKGKRVCKKREERRARFNVLYKK